MSQLLAGHDAHRRTFVACEAGGPLPGPTHGDDDAASGPGQIEVRQLGVASAPAHRSEPLFRLRRERRFKRHVIVGFRAAAQAVVQQELASSAAREGSVQGLYVLDHAGLRQARVSEVQRPLDRRKVAVLDGYGAHREVARRVRIGKRVFGAIRVKLARFALHQPLAQQLGRRTPVVAERERQLDTRRRFEWSDRQVGKPHSGSIRHPDPRHGPVGLVPFGLVKFRFLAHRRKLQTELARAAEVHVHRRAGNPLLEIRRTEHFAAGHFDRSLHAAAPLVSVIAEVIAVGADDGFKRSGGRGQDHADFARAGHHDAAVELAVLDTQCAAADGVLLDLAALQVRHHVTSRGWRDSFPKEPGAHELARLFERVAA